MNVWTAIKTKQIIRPIWKDGPVHVLTSDGKIGVIESVKRNETRGYLMVTLRHLDGSEFPHEYTATACELLDRTEMGKEAGVTETPWPACDTCDRPAQYLHIASGINACGQHGGGIGYLDRLADIDLLEENIPPPSDPLGSEA